MPRGRRSPALDAGTTRLCMACPPTPACSTGRRCTQRQKPTPGPGWPADIAIRSSGRMVCPAKDYPASEAGAWCTSGACQPGPASGDTPPTTTANDHATRPQQMTPHRQRQSLFLAAHPQTSPYREYSPTPLRRTPGSATWARSLGRQGPPGQTDTGVRSTTLHVDSDLTCRGAASLPAWIPTPRTATVLAGSRIRSARVRRAPSLALTECHDRAYRPGSVAPRYRIS